jgi:arylsulfatase/uncharacterized sulfatase
MAVYAGMIEAMDFNVGRLIEHLKATGQYDNTVIIVTSDNGAEGSDPLALALMRAWLPFSGYDRNLDTLGERGSYVFIGPEFANAAAAPGAWFKFTSAEGGLRVPLIVSAPGMDSTRVEHGLAYITDIPATIYDYATSRASTASAPPSAQASARANPHELVPDLNGMPSPTHMTGRSLRPVLEGTASAIRSPSDIVGMEAAGHSALFQGDYKLTRIYPPRGDKKWRLYDIQTDPGETTDLAAEEPARFESMLAAYQVWADANHVIPIPEDYDSFKQIQINFLHQIWQTKPWIFAIPVVGLALVLVGLWGAIGLVRRLIA